MVSAVLIQYSLAIAMVDNFRGITRDPTKYPDPESFRPERWLSPSFPTYREPLTTYPSLRNYHQFGYGRRVCQGIGVVEQELFLVMGGMAWAFDIRKKKDEFGKEIHVPFDKYTSLLIAKPEKFTFEMKIISEERRAMVEEGWKNVNGGRTEDAEVGIEEKGTLIEV
jgi:hypothetical protein